MCARPLINSAAARAIVEPIIAGVKTGGDRAVRAYTKKLDRVELKKFAVSAAEFIAAKQSLPPSLRRALTVATRNITKFHTAERLQPLRVTTMPGITCWREARPIEAVGLYVPGGTAPLPSTLLMLGIPAKLAGCKNIIVCTPPQPDGAIAPSILVAAQIVGIQKIYKVGGAQAIAAMAYGTKTITKVDKIFGPGNQFVTVAKQLVSIDPAGAAIDMPAGPSEVLVIADASARVDFVAADLLSQAEHGPDSQVVLVCTDEIKTKAILAELEQQLANLPRRAIAGLALTKSFALVVKNIAEAVNFANSYAPEHLIINIKKPNAYLSRIKNAGSVFVGPYSPESAGDYASGPNHTLPTNGGARAYSGVSLESFQKNITFQELSPRGAQTLGPIVAEIARSEGLVGHERAMKIRYL